MMKKLMIGAGLVMLIAAPALAASTTVEFTSDDGIKSEFTFREDGKMVTADGAELDYTMNEETKTICSTIEDNEVCATFADLGEEVGFSTTYTLNAGGGGTATITAIEE